MKTIEMTEEEKKKIRKLQAILAMIANNEKVFFNLANFRKMELITEKNLWGKDATGNKIIIGTKYGLSEKGKTILEATI